MKKNILIGLSSFFLFGCMPPVATSITPESVTIKYDPSLYAFETIQAKADGLCRDQYGKQSRFVTSDPPSMFYIQYATFACE